MRWLAGLTATALVAAAALRAHAQVGGPPPVLPAAGFTASANDESGLNVISHAGGVSGAGTQCDPAAGPIVCFDDSASVGPTRAFVNGTGTYSSASASVTVFYEVFGPVANLPVPVILDGGLFISGAETAFVSALISWNENTGVVAVSYLDGVPAEGKNVHVVFNTPSDVVENISLGASGQTCSIYRCIPDAGAWDATADPTLSIKPSFLAANSGYNLVYSPGVNLSPSPIPEPPARTAMLLGLAALGWMVRRAQVLRGLFDPRPRPTTV